MTLEFFIAAAMVLAMAAIIQGAAGFAFGLFATPMLLVIGLLPEQAIATVAASSFAQSAIGLWMLRHHVLWKLMLQIVPVAVLTLPLGVWLLSQVAQLDQSMVRQIFGCIVLAVLLLQWLWRVQPRDTLHKAWGFLAMATAGISTGAAGMASPPTVLWVTAHRWASARARATMYTVFVALTPPNLLFLYHRFGEQVSHAMWQGLIFVPLVVLATLPGLWLGNRLGILAMRRVAMTMLTAVSAYAILQPILWPQLG